MKNMMESPETGYSHHDQSSLFTSKLTDTSSNVADWPQPVLYQRQANSFESSICEDSSVRCTHLTM